MYAIKFSLNDKFKEMIRTRRASQLPPGTTIQLGFWERIAAGMLFRNLVTNLPCMPTAIIVIMRRARETKKTKRNSKLGERRVKNITRYESLTLEELHLKEEDEVGWHARPVCKYLCLSTYNFQRKGSLDTREPVVPPVYLSRLVWSVCIWIM